MSQPLLRNLFKPFPWILLLVAFHGCTQPGLVQSRSGSGPALVGSQPVVVEDSRRGARRPMPGRRDKVPAALAAQTLPPYSTALPESSPAQPLPLQSNAPQAIVVPSGDASGDCDYWIVSSRNCDGRH